jgi:hypothetical protein
MKPALFWTLKRDWHGRFDLMAVTTEKQGARGRYFGRDEHGKATHCLRGETHGRFTDAETATAARGGIKEIRDRYAVRVQERRRQIAELDIDRDAEIERYLRPFLMKVAA